MTYTELTAKVSTLVPHGTRRDLVATITRDLVIRGARDCDAILVGLNDLMPVGTAQLLVRLSEANALEYALELLDVSDNGETVAELIPAYRSHGAPMRSRKHFRDELREFVAHVENGNSALELIETWNAEHTHACAVASYTLGECLPYMV